MVEDEIVQRLDLIQATLALAFSSQIRAAGESIRADEINAAILDLSEQWIASPALQAAAAKATNKSERSVRDRLPALVAQRVLEMRGTERKQEFRRTGLI